VDHQYNFRVEDVTCEKCDVRIREALASLPGILRFDYVRTPENEAEVTLVSSENLAPQLIEECIEQKSVGTTHHYRVLWKKEG
jgi:copper chaperone CopZ